MTRRFVIAALVACGLALPTGAALAQPVQQGAVVSANPADWTPYVLDGEVDSVVEIGDTVIAGGTFTQVRSPLGGGILSRPYLVAFSKSTGRLSTTFVPTVDGPVDSLLATADGTGVYVGGSFGKVNGATKWRLALLDVGTGQLVTSFAPPAPNAKVLAMVRRGNELILSGTFTLLGTTARTVMASVSAATGALTATVNVAFAGPRTAPNGDKAPLSAERMSMTPDGTRIVVAGNFTFAGGLRRDQIAVLNLSGATATISTWQTYLYQPNCGSTFPSYIRDVDLSPDGTWFAVVTTGGPLGNYCDSSVRFELSPETGSRAPTWVDFTGGDTFTRVSVTDQVVYVGGHFRWLNNPNGSNSAGPGSVARTGLGALDPRNGLPVDWNPTRDRGVGVWDFTPTADGLWMGHDTNAVGGEFHPRLAFFPLAGGFGLPAEPKATLPVTVERFGPHNGTFGAGLDEWTFSGSAVTATKSMATTGYSTIRGAFRVGNLVYSVSTDGVMRVRTDDGATFGAWQTVNLHGLTSFAAEMPNIRSMAYLNGRILYTLTGSQALYMRYFTPSGSLVGATRFTVAGAYPGLTWASAAGSFIASGALYLAQTDGTLKRVGLAVGPAGSLTPTGTVTSVGGPTIDHRDWASLAMVEAVTPNPPTAGMALSCQGGTCHLDGTTSKPGSAALSTWSWDFGDGSTGTGSTATHTYTSSGTYPITLTVTDGVGLQATASASAAVVVTPTITLRDVAGDNTNATSHTVLLPAGAVAGDVALLWVESPSTAVAGAPAGWTQVGTTTSGNLVSTLYQHVVADGEAGQPVSVTTPSAAKAALSLAVYSGVDTTAPVLDSGVIDAPVTDVADHPTPVLSTGATAGAVLVSHWADRSSATSAWTVPAPATTRLTSIGTGAGHATSVVADSAGAVAGTVGGLTATADSASASAVGWSVLLRPAP